MTGKCLKPLPSHLGLFFIIIIILAPKTLRVVCSWRFVVCLFASKRGIELATPIFLHTRTRHTDYSTMPTLLLQKVDEPRDSRKRERADRGMTADDVDGPVEPPPGWNGSASRAREKSWSAQSLLETGRLTRVIEKLVKTSKEKGINTKKHGIKFGRWWIRILPIGYNNIVQIVKDKRVEKGGNTVEKWKTTN